MKKKGFSLTEVIVSVALFALLMGFAWPVLSNAITQRRRANEMARLEMHLHNVTELILVEQDPEAYLEQTNAGESGPSVRYRLTTINKDGWVAVCLTDTVFKETLSYEVYP